MHHAIVFDCEFLVDDGALQRFWNGPRDPDPQVVQIGACKLSLEGDFDILDTHLSYITPIGRDGAPVPLAPLFTQLTGITQDTLDRKGQDYAEALAAFDLFSDGAPLWSWGKDELNLIGTGAMIHNIAPPIPLTRFRNAVNLLLAAGVAYDTATALRSHTMLDHFGLTAPKTDPKGGPVGRAHDALADATQVAGVLQHLLRDHRLTAADFAA